MPETGTPCPTCLLAVLEGTINREAVQPLPERAGPLLRSTGRPCCRDCAATDTLLRLAGMGEGLTWDMARHAVANDRREQLRLPGAPLGLIGMGLMQPNAEGDLQRHWAWLEANGLMTRPSEQ
jgi:hypothetical protein